MRKKGVAFNNMNRDSIVYKTRRKLQVLAYHIIPKKVLSGIYYRILLHEKMNLKNPKYLNEKLQWLKLNYYPHNSLAIKCTDKYQVREYIENKGYGSYLTGLIGEWTSVDDVDWESLPQQFVLKCTHGCASDLINDRQAKMGFFEMNGTKIPLIRDDYEDIGILEMPKCLKEMIEAAKVLSKDFPFVRVDFFLVGESFKFAELTFSPASGYMPINPKEYDLKWGNLLDLPEVE